MKCSEVSEPDHIPKERHYQIIVFKKTSVHIPGDERSRTNPGHGYPEHTETYNTPTTYVTTDDNDWLADIQTLMAEKPGRKDMVAFMVEGVASIRLETKVDIK